MALVRARLERIAGKQLTFLIVMIDFLSLDEDVIALIHPEVARDLPRLTQKVNPTQY